MKIQSINPYNQKTLESFRLLTNSQVTEILKRSQKAFFEWRQTSYEKRASYLCAVAVYLKKEKERLGRDISLEMGKPIKEAIAEVEKCAWVCDYYAEHASEFLKDEPVASDASQSWIKYQPLGPVLAIMPWNYPLWQVFRFATPALMAGNSCLLKHASNVSRCALNIEQVFKEAGFPEDLFRTLIIDVKQVKSIIENPMVKAVTLTGSEKAGSSVAGIAGNSIKKTVLELGGSNAFIVLADADLEDIVDEAVRARFQNAGQSCIAAKRFIVEKAIAGRFTTRFQQEVSRLQTGDPLNEQTQIGPMARVDLAEELQNQVERSLAAGAVLLWGGTRNQAFYSPTILTEVKPGMPAFDEELFGPVAPITIASDADHALQLANTSQFGLGATVCTRDMKKAQMFIEHIEDGAVFVNALVKSDPRLPFGGTKRSGYGRELSYHGIREFVNVKTVYIQ